jgi:hypothetical protein
VIYHLNFHDHTGLAETQVFAADDGAAIGRARGSLIAGDQGRLGYLSGDMSDDDDSTGRFRKTEMCRLAISGTDLVDEHEGVAR